MRSHRKEDNVFQNDRGVPGNRGPCRAYSKPGDSSPLLNSNSYASNVLIGPYDVMSLPSTITG